MKLDYDQCVILRSRYGGTYEGGAWVCFPCRLDQVPDDAFDGDGTCMNFWGRWNRPAPKDGQPFIGAGDSPQAAYDDMVRRLAAWDGTESLIKPAA